MAQAHGHDHDHDGDEHDHPAMGRRTSQRDAIREAFEHAGRPLAPQEVLVEAQKRVPKLGIATVYRTVKSLVDERWLVTVELPGEPPRYELSKLSHHHHFHCRACGRAFDIPGCPGHMRLATPPGFVVEEHEIVLYGRCPDCSKARK